MNFFETLISPFTHIIRQLFLLGYELTGSYGLAIVLLSFAISLLLLPVFMLIERAKRRDDAVKRRMKPVLDEIKRCYKGQERYYYIRTLHRQHGYSSLKALVPVLSLLLQIPFFIAAYQFLLDYEPLVGEGFLFIKDLSTPDGVFGSINLLPIVMTLVNIATAYLYTRNGDTAERKQMLAIAGVFLVLLFNLPSGLVLYWTMNNVFSFLRLFVTNPEVFKRSIPTYKPKESNLTSLKSRLIPLVPKLKRTFIVISVVAILGQLHWAFQHSFDDIMLRIALTVTGSFLLTVLIASLNLAYHIKISLKNKSIKEIAVSLWPTFRATLVIAILLALLPQINWALKHNFDDFVLRVLLSAVAGALFVVVLAVTALAYQGKISLKHVSFNFHLDSLGPVYSIAFWVLLALIVATQLNWAIKHNFDDIILRISAAIAGCWLTILFFANLLAAIKRVTKLTAKDLLASFYLAKRKVFRAYLAVTLVGVAFQIYWSTQNSFDGFAVRLAILILGMAVMVSMVFLSVIVYTELRKRFEGIILPPWIFFSLFFISTYFYFAARFFYSNENHDISLLALILIIPVQLMGLFYFIRNRRSVGGWWCYSAAITMVALFVMQLVNIWALFEPRVVAVNILNLKWTVSESKLIEVVLPGLLLSLVTFPFYLADYKVRITNSLRINWLLYTLLIVYLVGFVFLWNPIAIYSSYPGNFEFPAIDILKNNIIHFLLAAAALSAIYFLLPKRIKHYWLIFILALSAISFLHNTVIPIDVGTLQENKFVKQGNLAQPIAHYIYEGLAILLIIFGAKKVVERNYIKQLTIAFILLNFVLISQSLIQAVNTGSFLTKEYPSSDISSSISLSKDKENIVFVILDMFHGWYMDRIIKEAPDVAAQLDGFVWYPNTLSVSNITGSAIAPILGGFDYTIDKLNKDKSRTLQEKITDVTIEFYEKVKSEGYSFTANEMMYSKIDEDYFDAFLPKWHEDWDRWNEELMIGVSKEVGFRLLWENALFYSTPLFLKPKIYNQGQWLGRTIKTNENTSKTQPYHFLRLLPRISDTLNDKSSFIYLHLIASHHPWDAIDENGVLVPNVSPYENNQWTLKTLNSWFEWMKVNDVYDNTRIVILSDHGPHWGHYQGEVDCDAPIVENPQLGMSTDMARSLIALLLVKDFSATGEVSKDWRFMSNSDAKAIAFNNDSITKPSLHKTRTLPTSVVDWERKLWELNTLNIRHQFEVTNDVYDLRNWRRVE